MEIINLTNELKRLRETSSDVITPRKAIHAIEDGGTLKLDLSKYGKWPLTRHGGVQLAEKAGIPTLYFHKMIDNGMAGLAAENVNQWFQKPLEKQATIEETAKKNGEGENQLVRIADGSVRAILSDKYRRLDNYDLALNVMDKAKTHGAEIAECQLTETRMYIDLRVPQYQEEVRAGDPAVPGLIVSNSEVGAGAFRVEPRLFRLVCKNGLVGSDALYKVHLGQRMEIGTTIYRDDTLQNMDRALWGQVRDIIEATFDARLFKKQIEQFRQSKSLTIPEPQEALDAVAKDLSLSEEKERDLLRYFAKEGDTVYGLVNGITRLAQDSKDFDQRIEIERYAGKKLEAAIAVPTQ